ncbi:purine and uridine phosphorylase [Daldinia bambusicola]|nr:purine and uridine phosphorylase [Daldinia bambusicola]
MEELRPDDYCIIWIAPLEIEAQAALHMLDNRHNGKFPMARGDDYVFKAGDMCGHNVVIATLPAGQEYGTGSAAALASQAKRFFPNFWFGLLVGVAAGIPDLQRDPQLDIRLGDVLVSIPDMDRSGTIAYDLGKDIGDDMLQLLRQGHILAQTEPIVRSAIGSIKLDSPHEAKLFLSYYENMKDKRHANGTFTDPGQDCDEFYEIGADGNEHIVERPKRADSERTRVWYGPIGSGEKLMRNASKRDMLRDKYGIIGLEMEAAGIMNRIPVGIIRGACDYADEHKNKAWQPYAAAMAAAYAKAVLAQISPGQTPNRSIPPSQNRYGQDRNYKYNLSAFNSNSARSANGDPDNTTDDESEREIIIFKGRGNQNIGSGNISIGGGQYFS